MENKKEKKGLGCFGMGCLSIVLIIVVVIGIVGFLYYTATRSIRQYTSGSEKQIAIEDTGAPEYEAIVQKMADFKKLPPGSNATLSITAHDLNVLIARSPEWHLARGKIHVTVADGRVGLIGSIPLSSIPLLRDQYMGGSLYFTPSIEEKVFRAKIQEIKSDTHPIPADIAKGIIAGLEPNLNNRLLGDPVIGAVIIKSESLKIENDTLIFTSAK